MNRAASICLLLVLWLGSAAFATTTSQIWYFHSDDTMAAPDFSANPFGTAVLWVHPVWVVPHWEVVDGRLGVWVLSGGTGMIVKITNDPMPCELTEIIIDLVWAPAGNDEFMLDEPLAGVIDTTFEGFEMSYTDELLSGDWYHTRYDMTIWPNPPEEWITIGIKGDILIDEIMIRTECIPEPATVGLLGLGGLALLGVRRKG